MEADTHAWTAHNGPSNEAPQARQHVSKQASTPASGHCYGRARPFTCSLCVFLPNCLSVCLRLCRSLSIWRAAHRAVVEAWGDN
eukprot:scaffold114982_cov69-Phaeocystis_antarctica.AAC.2